MLSLVVISKAFSQQIPVGECGIVYIYDANGARIKRVYFCNNGIDPYPTANRANELFVQRGSVAEQEEATDMLKTKATINETTEFQIVDAIYPNPTNGIFIISFRSQLTNADIIITDSGGKTVRKTKASGLKVSFDISSLAAGTYFIFINQSGTSISKKVVKI